MSTCDSLWHCSARHRRDCWADHGWHLGVGTSLHGDARAQHAARRGALNGRAGPLLPAEHRDCSLHCPFPADILVNNRCSQRHTGLDILLGTLPGSSWQPLAFDRVRRVPFLAGVQVRPCSIGCFFRALRVDLVCLWILLLLAVGSVRPVRMSVPDHS